MMAEVIWNLPGLFIKRFLIYKLWTLVMIRPKSSVICCNWLHGKLYDVQSTKYLDLKWQQGCGVVLSMTSKAAPPSYVTSRSRRWCNGGVEPWITKRTGVLVQDISTAGVYAAGYELWAAPSLNDQRSRLSLSTKVGVGV